MSSAIEVQQLVKRYGRVPAVDGVSLSVNSGEIVGYLGPNGAGKTTTIRCLLGLLRPSSGSVRLLRERLPDGLPGVLDDVGHIPGEFGLWPQLTGAGCLDYLGRLAHRRPCRRAELCDRFELSETELARPVRYYSRGMRQKIAIVQAFQHGPELVIMDEPTEGLDPVVKERFLQLLHEHRATGGKSAGTTWRVESVIAWLRLRRVRPPRCRRRCLAHSTSRALATSCASTTGAT